MDYSGTYTGVMNVTETGKEIKVTTVVTYEKDFGMARTTKSSAPMMKPEAPTSMEAILCGGPQEANIAGAKFVFSSDGTSFTSSMRITTIKRGFITCSK